MAFRVVIRDRVLGRLHAFGEDGQELRFRTMEEAASIVHPMVGHGKRWPCLFSIEPATGPAQPVVSIEPPRRFRRLGKARGAQG